MQAKLLIFDLVWLSYQASRASFWLQDRKNKYSGLRCSLSWENAYFTSSLEEEAIRAQGRALLVFSTQHTHTPLLQPHSYPPTPHTYTRPFPLTARSHALIPTYTHTTRSHAGCHTLHMLLLTSPPHPQHHPTHHTPTSTPVTPIPTAPTPQAPSLPKHTHTHTHAHHPHFHPWYKCHDRIFRQERRFSCL